MQPRLPMFLSSVAIGIVFAVGALSLVGSEAKARVKPVAASAGPLVPAMSVTAPTNAPLSAIYNRLVLSQKRGAWKEPSRVPEIQMMLKRGTIRSGADFYYAATIASKDRTVESTLLAHDLSLAAMAMGESRARSLAAATQDQFLSLIGRKQRFGTQIAPTRGLVAVDSSVTDGMRQILGLPALATAKRFALSGQPLTSVGASVRAAPSVVAAVD